MDNLPPIVQIAIAGFLILFTTVSILGRINPSVGNVVFSRANSNTRDHFIDYTVVPALISIGVCTAIIWNWDSNKNFFGELAWWTGAAGIFITIVVGLVPSVTLFAALWPLTRRADRENPQEPLKTTAGRLYIACLIASIIMLPTGVIIATMVRKWLLGK